MFSLTENRLTRSYAEVKERYDSLSPAKQASLDEEMAVTFEEHFAYQNAQARAHLMNVLDLDEAQIVYTALGEVGDPSNGGWASETDTPTKVVVTLLMGELLSRPGIR